MPDLRQFSILKIVNFEPFRRFFEKQNCRKSAIFYPIWANFVALSLKMSSKCDAPIEKNSKLPEDVFLETLKIVRAQNSFFAITWSNFIRFAWDQFYVLQHENTLLYNMPKAVLKQKITQNNFYADFGCLSTF